MRTRLREQASRLHAISMCAFVVAASALRLPAQELVPRAYVIAPIHFNAIILIWSFFDGGVNLNGSTPITGADRAILCPYSQLLLFCEVPRTVWQHHRLAALRSRTFPGYSVGNSKIDLPLRTAGP
jgi:hypothetical protein